MAINSLIARLGTPDPIEIKKDVMALAAGFEMTRLGRAPARFDPEELDRLNAKILHETDYADIADKLTALGVGGGEAFWLAVREILKKYRYCRAVANN